MIDGIPVEALTPGALLGVAILLMFLGKLVPIGRVKEVQKTADYWRDVADRKDAIITTQAETNHLLSKEVGESVNKVMSAIQQRAGVSPREVVQAQTERPNS